MLDILLRHLDMVRLTIGTVALLCVVGCSGLIDDTNPNLTPEEVAAREMFVSRAKPVFDSYCISCHAGLYPEVAFIAGTDAISQRATALAFDPPVVNFDAVESSRILTKGAHSGPALTAQQSSDILEWINAEREAAGAAGGLGPILATPHFTPLLCTSGQPGESTCPINYVDLLPLVAGWGGAQIKFVAQPLTQDLYLTNLSVVPGPDGVYVEHPLFVSYPPDASAEPIPDTLDRFFNVKINIMPGGVAQPIGGGTAAFINFTPTNQVAIHFKVVDKYRPDEGGGGGTTQTGCRQLESFKTNAKGPLQTNCASCHAGTANANARSAMDLTGIAAADDPTLQAVCDQARTRINFTDTNQSGFFIAPNPAVTTNHPFKFGGVQATFDAFKAAVDVWVQAEKTSL